MANKNPNPATRFKPGVAQNPGGKPKEARNTLTLAFIKAISEDFSANGVGAVETLRKEKPDKYLELVATLIPKQVDIDQTVTATHEHRSVSQTAEWVAGILGTGINSASAKPVSH
jgi:hypothetical protein